MHRWCFQVQIQWKTCVLRIWFQCSKAEDKVQHTRFQIWIYLLACSYFFILFYYFISWARSWIIKGCFAEWLRGLIAYDPKARGSIPSACICFFLFYFFSFCFIFYHIYFLFPFIFYLTYIYFSENISNRNSYYFYLYYFIMLCIISFEQFFIDLWGWTWVVNEVY